MGTSLSWETEEALEVNMWIALSSGEGRCVVVIPFVLDEEMLCLERR